MECLQQLATEVPGSAPAARLPEVTVVVPCYNESEGIDHLHQKLAVARETLAARYTVHYLFVDDGSRDDTAERLEELVARFPESRLVRHGQNRGLVAAIATGLRHADTELVCSLDADCTYDPACLGDLLEYLRDDVALVTASPYHPRGKVENVPEWRLWISGACSAMYRGVLRTRLYTYTSCFRAYRRSALADWQPSQQGFVGLVEMIHHLEEQGATVVECPAVLRVRQFGQSKMRVARVASQHLQFMAQTWWRRWVPSRHRASPRTAMRATSVPR